MEEQGGGREGQALHELGRPLPSNIRPLESLERHPGLVVAVTAQASLQKISAGVSSIQPSVSCLSVLWGTLTNTRILDYSFTGNVPLGHYPSPLCLGPGWAAWSGSASGSREAPSLETRSGPALRHPAALHTCCSAGPVKTSRVLVTCTHVRPGSKRSQATAQSPSPSSRPCCNTTGFSLAGGRGGALHPRTPAPHSEFANHVVWSGGDVNSGC